MRIYRSFFILYFIVAIVNGILSQGALYTNANFTKTINTTLPVGTIPAAADVDLSGAATYSIPIIVPPGTNGVQPSLSVVYNSLGGNGALGQGWSLAGLSSITRVNRDLIHDNLVNPIEANANDRFALDGVRLNLVTGSYGLSGSVYGTEIESFASISCYTSAVTNQIAFNVTQKNGVVYEYGNTGNSITSDNGVVPHIWRLNKIRYQDGNYIEYVYATDNNNPRISEINYTGNTSAGLAPYSKISFTYVSRSDVNTVYIGTIGITNNYFLDKITITAEGLAGFKSYRFYYGWDLVNSYLTEVVEMGSDNTLLNSTIFKYGDQPAIYTSLTTGTTGVQTANYFSGDFNTDGFSDLVEAVTNVSNGVEYTSKFNLYKSNGTTGFTGSYTKNLPGNFSSLKKKSIPDVYTFYTNDYTGDGIDDLVAAKTSGSVTANNLTLDFVRIYKGSQGLNNFNDSITINPYTGYSKINNTTQHYLFSGDFNGDGMGDLVSMLSTTTGGPAGIHLYHGGISSGFLTVGSTGTVNIQLSTWPTANRIQVLDFNGDGKSDLMITSGNWTEVFTFDNYVVRSIYYSAYPTNTHLVFFGDFNGDRKMDILSRADKNNNASAWSIYASTGTGFVSTAFGFSVTPNINETGAPDKIVLLDANGDGKTDIFHATSASPATTLTYFSKGNSFQVQSQVQTFAINTMPFTPFDINGDGKSELLTRVNNTSPFFGIYFMKDGKELYLEKVKNGYNHTTQWAYKRLNEQGSFYGRGAILTGKVNNVLLPFTLASSIVVDNGIGTTNTTNYTYEELKIHKEGRGLMGFLRNISHNTTTGIQLINENEFETTSYFTSAAKIITTKYVPNSFQLLSQITNTNQWVSTGSGKFYSRVNGINENNSFTTQSTVTTLGYDSYGNINSNTVNVQSGLETTTTTTVFGQHGTPVPSLPTSVSTTITRSGQSAYSFTNTYGYNTLSQMISSVEFSGLPKAKTTTFAYNSFGNQTSATVSATGITTRTPFTHTFDTKGRYPITTVTQQGTLSVVYSPLWGKPTQVTGIDGVVTTFSYDAFGRQTSQTIQPSVTISTGYGYATGGPITKTTVTTTGKPQEIIYYDLLDREIKSETEGWQNYWITTLKSYNAKGNLTTVTGPYKSGLGETGEINTTNYDGYNRISSTVNNKGGTNYTTTYGYAYASGNTTVTVTNPASQVSSKVTDASGKTTSATDYGGTLNYTYYSHGGLKTVVNGANTLVTNNYDAYARQSSLVDINAGTTTYDYNALGELVSQINAKSQTHTMTYDLAGRMLTKVMPEGTMSYEYHTTGTGSAGKLKKITSYSGHIEEYTYDIYGRVATKKDRVDATDYIKTYGYTTSNLLSSIAYPSGFVLNYNYDTKGYLSTITNGATTIFSTGTMNGYNQYLTYTLGNGVTSTNTYHFGIPTNYTAGTLQNLSMVWNYSTGNLTSRTDNLVTKTESFVYDNLNRLTSSTVTGLTTQNIAYNANGNIISKTDAGTYTYGSASINAVTQINPSAGNISTVSQSLPTYTSFLQPASLSEGSNTLTFTYGTDENRVKTVTTQSGSTTNTHYFFGDYEIDISGGITRHIHYISAGDGLVSIVTNTSGTNGFLYAYTDHLGSIVKVTNNGGSVVLNRNYDVWGRYRNPSAWDYSSTGTSSITFMQRGYTGHEHLPLFNIINMNGRLYDPVVGRMMAVDNNIQAPDLTQNYNRYSYALNNPLKYTDPDGEWLHIVIGGIIGGTANLLIKGFQGKINNLGDGLKAFGIGAVAGAVTAATGGAAGVLANGGTMATAFSYSAVSAAGSSFLGGAVVGGVGSAFGSPILGIGNQIAFGDPYSLESYGRDVLFGAAIGAASGQISKWLSKSKSGVNPNSGEINPPGKITGISANESQIADDFNSYSYLESIGDNVNGYTLKNDLIVHSIESSSSKTSSLFTHGFKYANKVRERALTDPRGHNFPYSFDDLILKSNPINKPNGYQIFRLNGTMNGNPGFFEIGLTKENIIDHRVFRIFK